MARLSARLARLAAVAATCTLALVLARGIGADPHGAAARLRTENAALAQRTQRAVLDLYALETQLGRAHARVVALQQQTVRVRTAQALVRRELGITRHVLVVSQHHLGTRLRTLYEEGDVDPLAVLLGARSLDEALTSLDALQRATAQSERVMRQTHATKSRLGRLARELHARGTQLATLTRDARSAEAALVASRSQRVALISSLRTRERLNAATIASLDATARAAEARSAQLTAAESAPAPAPAVAPVPAPASLDTSDTSASPPDSPAPAGARTIVVVATGYSIHGPTATGVPTGWGVAAVDPGVIPLGTRFDVPGYGVAVAADTGGAVRGATVDLWFPTLGQARAWGRRTVTITLH